MSADEDLYQRLGGKEAIDAVVDEFYDRVLADDRVNHHFDGTDVEALREHQKLFIASVAGGPVEYGGQELAAAHADLGITDDEFGIVADHLTDALLAHDVPEREREALLAAVADTKPAVVSG